MTLTLDDTDTAVTTINASASKGSVVITTVANDAAATTVTGGNGADTLTAKGTNDVLIGGAGDDTLAVSGSIGFVKLTGGVGTDTFDLSGFTPASQGSYASIQDLSNGEFIKLVASTKAYFAATKFVLGGSASFESYVNQAMASATTAAKSFNASNTDHGIAWFQYTSNGQTNTYIVQDVDGNSTFSSNDIVVEIVGSVDLSSSSLNASTAGTLKYIV